MKHIRHAAQIDLPIDVCFQYVDDYRNVSKWLFGVSEFTPIGHPERGLGTSISIAAKIGPLGLHGLGKVCEYAENEVIAVKADLGPVKVVIAWLFRATAPARTEITADVSYAPAHGLAGRAALKVAEPAIMPAVRHSERELRKLLLTHD